MAPTEVGGIGLVAEDVHIGKQAAEPLTLEGIRTRRAKAGKLDAPTASYSDSDMFKAPVSYTPMGQTSQSIGSCMLTYDL